MVTWLTIILGLLPAIVWMIFFLWEDKKKPEPKKLIISTFIWGGLITFVVLQFQWLFNFLLKPLGIQEFSPISLFLMGGIEEFFKFLVVFLWIKGRREFDEPIDAMVYMIIAALGFATTENIASAIRSAGGFELVTLRFLGATLLHSLSSAFVGYYWALSLIKKASRARLILTGLLIATLIHSIFNSLILIYGPALQVTLFLVFIAFFVLSDFEKLKNGPSPSQQ